MHVVGGQQNGTVLVGRGRDFQRIPERDFVEMVRGLPARMGKHRAFMTEQHVSVREYVVREMREDEPLTPGRIGDALHLPVAVVTQLLADLERNLFFLVRAADGVVNWAFPVTVERTAHRLSFS